MKKIKIITALMLVLTMAFFAVACENGESKKGDKENITVKNDEKKAGEETKTEEGANEKMETQYVKITMEDNREIVIELLPEYAPMSVEFFLELVGDEYYDGLVFHRAVEGFMIQGGSPNGDGIGGCGRTVKGEFSSNGIKNDLSHKRGVVSFARTNIKDSASGQFFIMHDDGEFLDGNYAAFGRVVEGMDVVDEIATRATAGEMLIDKPVIKTVRVLKNYKAK